MKKKAKIIKEAKVTKIAEKISDETEGAERVEKHGMREAVKETRGGIRQKTKGFTQRVFRRKAI